MKVTTANRQQKTHISFKYLLKLAETCVETKQAAARNLQELSFGKLLCMNGLCTDHILPASQIPVRDSQQVEMDL